MAVVANKVISITNHKTSIRLAPAEWEALKTISIKENISTSDLFELINLNKNEILNLTSAIRLFTLIYFINFLKDPQKTTLLTKDGIFISPVFDAIKEIS